MDESGEIIRLEQGCPWKEHLYDLEGKLSLPESSLKFVLYKEEETDKWRVQVSGGLRGRGKRERGGRERGRKRERGKREGGRERERDDNSGYGKKFTTAFCPCRLYQYTVRVFKIG